MHCFLFSIELWGVGKIFRICGCDQGFPIALDLRPKYGHEGPNKLDRDQVMADILEWMR